MLAIYFLWKREMIRFLRSKSRIIGSLAMPFFFLAILGTGLSGAMKLPGMNGNYLEFITPGILGMVLLFGSMFLGISVIIDRQFGFLKETLIAPVKRTTLVIGKTLGNSTAAVIQGILMLLLSVFLGVTIQLQDILFTILLMFLISSAFVCLGIAIASKLEDMHGFQLIMNFLMMPMFFLSGALFPLTSAPQIIQTIAYFDPMLYAVEALRFSLLGYSSMPILISVSILIAFFIATTFLAAYFFNRIES
ncbi:MAG: hypothetical protein COT15_02585 [Candidatus Diapherotrites archaeon CG08_land_8_20_14_0_20_34_12]|nr:MAG: hypothetical protein COT15_02585 [Candidatus Diapherotrites archaeon CG08_land_8_20_14_0_20_34_12]